MDQVNTEAMPWVTSTCVLWDEEVLIQDFFVTFFAGLDEDTQSSLLAVNHKIFAYYIKFEQSKICEIQKICLEVMNFFIDRQVLVPVAKIQAMQEKLVQANSLLKIQDQLYDTLSGLKPLIAAQKYADQKSLRHLFITQPPSTVKKLFFACLGQDLLYDSVKLNLNNAIETKRALPTLSPQKLAEAESMLKNIVPVGMQPIIKANIERIRNQQFRS